MTKKQQHKEQRAQWRRWLAAGQVVETIVAGQRSLAGYPTKELADAIVEATDGADGASVRVLVVSLEEQAAKLGLAEVPAEWLDVSK